MNDLERVYDDYLALTEKVHWDSSNPHVWTSNRSIRRNDAERLTLFLLDGKDKSPADVCNDARVCGVVFRPAPGQNREHDIQPPLKTFQRYDRTLSKPVLPRHPEILLRLKALSDE